MTDPLLDLVQEYRSHHAIYNASRAPDGSDEERTLHAAWYDPYARLMDDPPAATTLAGAIEAIRLVRDEERDCGGQPDLTINVLAAALAFFDTRMAR